MITSKEKRLMRKRFLEFCACKFDAAFDRYSEAKSYQRLIVEVEFDPKKESDLVASSAICNWKEGGK